MNIDDEVEVLVQQVLDLSTDAERAAAGRGQTLHEEGVAIADGAKMLSEEVFEAAVSLRLAGYLFESMPEPPGHQEWFEEWRATFAKLLEISVILRDFADRLDGADA